MEATFVALRNVFEKTLMTHEQCFAKVMKHAMTMSRHPTPEDTLSELSRSEVVCLMAITSLGMLDVTMSNTMSKAVDEWKLFPRITSYFGGKINVEYNIPKAFLVKAYEFARYGNKLGFLEVPLDLVSYIKVLISEASEEDASSSAPGSNVPGPSESKDHAAVHSVQKYVQKYAKVCAKVWAAVPKAADHVPGPSARKADKSRKHQAADETHRLPSPPSARQPSPPIPTVSSKSAEQSAPSARSPNQISDKQNPIPSSTTSSTSVITPFLPLATTSSTSVITPFSSPAKPKTTPVARVLPQPSARPSRVPDDRTRATRELSVAARRWDVRAVEAAIQAGADIHVRDEEGWTPLHRAARYGSVTWVSALLDSGAGIDTLIESTMWTPLHLAALGGHLPCAKLLVERGADLNPKDRNGDTPLALAGYKYYHTTADYLQSVGGTT